MNMKPIICFGEALIDFLNFGKVAESGIMLDEYRQYPGGAPANVAVAVARLGGRSYFAGQIGADMFGDFLQNSLEYYQVNTHFLMRHPTAKTALAFVALDDEGDRSFSFYREQTADVLIQPDQISSHWFENQGLFHFCSNSLTDEFISKTTVHAVMLAKEANNLISFDVNLRDSLWPKNKIDVSLVNQLVCQSDVVKFSKEEAEYLAQQQCVESYIQDCLLKGVKLIVITDGGGDIYYYCHGQKYTVQPPTVNVIDTTAGGDAFSGGLLYGLSTFTTYQQAISDPQVLKPLILFAAACGGIAVSKPGAFPALPELSDVNSAWLALYSKIK